MVVECTKGLDTVEFIMRIEDCFGISIPDRDAEQLTLKTVGHLFAYLRERIPASSSTDCLTSKSFYRLRQSLVRITGQPRESIRPDTVLEELLPDKTTRQEQWAELEEDLGLKLPPLELPKAIAVPIIAIMCILFIAGLLGFPFKQYWIPLVLWSLDVAFVALGFRLTKPMVTEIRACRTVGGLAKLVSVARFPFMEEGASDRQIWEAIVSVLGVSAGMEASQITRELRFLEIPSDL